jgi:hypothetical protein
MKSRFIVLAPILGATVFVVGHAQAACNARQEFCTYPTWAANAFSPQAQNLGSRQAIRKLILHPT